MLLSQTFLESGMGYLGLIQGIKLLGIQVRIVASRGRPPQGVVMILSTISIGSQGKVSRISCMYETKSLTSFVHRHPSKETMRIMADYVVEVINTCRVLL